MNNENSFLAPFVVRSVQFGDICVVYDVVGGTGTSEQAKHGSDDGRVLWKFDEWPAAERLLVVKAAIPGITDFSTYRSKKSNQNSSINTL